MMMILCTADEYEAARAANPGVPILCTDIEQLHMPGYDRGIAMGRYRTKMAIESPNSEPFAP